MSSRQPRNGEGRRLTALELAGICGAAEGGESVPVIAVRHGASRETIRGILRRAGITPGNASPGPTPGALRKELPMRQIAAQYSGGESLAALGRRYGVGAPTISRHLIAYGVPVRDWSTAQRVRHRKARDARQ